MARLLRFPLRPGRLLIALIAGYVLWQIVQERQQRPADPGDPPTASPRPALPGSKPPAEPFALHPPQPPADPAAVETRLREAVGFLASDQLEGRGIHTSGIDLAADYLAQQFAAAGLRADLYDGSPFHQFRISSRLQLGENNRATILGLDDRKQPLVLGRDYRPLSISAPATIDLPLVFVGYGITAPSLGYDDYAGVDVHGKAVIMLRHAPQSFTTTAAAPAGPASPSPFGYFSHKIPNAVKHGAAAVLICSDRRHIVKQTSASPTARRKLSQTVELPAADDLPGDPSAVDEAVTHLLQIGGQLPPECDPLLRFEIRNSIGKRLVPVLHCRRHVVDRMLRSATSNGLYVREQQIASQHSPQSCSLEPLRLEAQVSITLGGKPLKNVVAMLPGDGTHGNETILIGAHYDHLGMGGGGTLAPWTVAVHNGADDNASGTAVLVEVARQLAARDRPLPRRLLFVAFTAEESGLVGSSRYARAPAVPLEDTIAMLNLDMVGRLRNDTLIVTGVGTAQEFGPLVDALASKYELRVRKRSGGYGPSDHATFYARGVPVLHFFTGLHNDYHRPSDDVEKLNIEGMRRIAALVADLAVQLATAERRPTKANPSDYVARSGPTPSWPAASPSGNKAYLGIRYQTVASQGVVVTRVQPDSPADKAGLRAGDVIVGLAGTKISTGARLQEAIKAQSPAATVPLHIRRGSVDLEVSATLTGR